MQRPHFISTAIVSLILAFGHVSHAELLNGAQLYAKHCAKCHNSLQGTVKAGRRAKRIQSAIDANIGGMAFLKDLSRDEVQAISDALTRLEPPPDYLSGKDLYRIYCSSCHRPIEKTRIKCKTATDVLAAMKSRSCIEVDLRFLDSEDRLKIAEALRPSRPAPANNSK